MITILPVEHFLNTWVGIAVLLGLSVWSITWKGFALWRSAKKGEKKWFIALLIINTVGLLEILYLFVFSKQKQAAAPQE